VAIKEDFETFHENHPEVYSHLVSLARQWKSATRNTIGIKTLYERLRWEYGIQGKDQYGFKLNNNYTAYYARLIMENNPELAGMFELRKVKQDA
jgi:hypothetical protein